MMTPFRAAKTGPAGDILGSLRFLTKNLPKAVCRLAIMLILKDFATQNRCLFF